MEQRKEAHELIHRFIHVNRLHRRIIERWADEVGMHCSEHRMLMHISRFDKVPSQRDLAERLKITPAAVTNTLKKLECDGYISRTKRADSTDSRYNEISITERGRNAIAASEKYFNQVDCATINGLSEEEMDTLSNLLQRIEDNLVAAEAELCPSPTDDLPCHSFDTPTERKYKTK